MFGFIQAKQKYDYGIAPAVSIFQSPDVSVQQIGNCTIYSQKLAVLYSLNHQLEHHLDAAPLAPEAGLGLAEKIWHQISDRVYQDFLQDSHLTLNPIERGNLAEVAHRFLMGQAS